MLKTFGNVRDGLAPARAFGRRYIPRAKLKKIHSDKRARLNQRFLDQLSTSEPTKTGREKVGSACVRQPKLSAYQYG
jgi:hypothetical protein